MAGSFTVGALATASPEANAVGAVRLTLLPRRLEIELLKASSYAEGFAPGALTSSVRLSVPYTAVRGFVRRSEGLALSLDPLVVTPYNRFFLTNFTDLPLEALASAHKRRKVARALLWLVPAPVAALVLAEVPQAWASGPLGRASAGVLLLIALALVARKFAESMTFGGPYAARLRSALEHRLAQRVGIVPRASHETDPFEVPELPDVVTAPASREPPPRPSPGLVAARATPARAPMPWLRLAFSLAAVVLVVGAASAYREIARIEPEPPPVARAGLAGAVAPSDDAVAASEWPACSCERAASPLWEGGVPVLSVLPTAKRREGREALGDISPRVDDRGVSRYDFDLAVVNNAAEALRDVRVILTFARRDVRGRRVGVRDRGLFWEGELDAGRSVKWGVRAPGTEVRIDVDEKRLLGEVAPAPASSYQRLLGARQPLVRLHAATMLAYLGDPGAAEAARGLGELPPADELTRQRILRAVAPVRACDVHVEGGNLGVCVHNATSALVREATVVEVAPDGRGRRRSVGEPLPPGAGIRLTFDAFGEAPEELVVEEGGASATPPG